MKKFVYILNIWIGCTINELLIDVIRAYIEHDALAMMGLVEHLRSKSLFLGVVVSCIVLIIFTKLIIKQPDSSPIKLISKTCFAFAIFTFIALEFNFNVIISTSILYVIYTLLSIIVSRRVISFKILLIFLIIIFIYFMFGFNGTYFVNWLYNIKKSF